MIWIWTLLKKLGQAISEENPMPHFLGALGFLIFFCPYLNFDLWIGIRAVGFLVFFCYLIWSASLLKKNSFIKLIIALGVLLIVGLILFPCFSRAEEKEYAWEGKLNPNELVNWKDQSVICEIILGDYCYLGCLGRNPNPKAEIKKVFSIYLVDYQGEEIVGFILKSYYFLKDGLLSAYILNGQNRKYKRGSLDIYRVRVCLECHAPNFCKLPLLDLAQTK